MVISIVLCPSSSWMALRATPRIARCDAKVAEQRDRGLERGTRFELGALLTLFLERLRSVSGVSGPADAYPLFAAPHDDIDLPSSILSSSHAHGVLRGREPLV